MNLFKREDFGVFEVEGLDERMELIRERIQPIFQEIGDTYIKKINEETGYKMSFHIAQHRRRTANAPESTWSAFGGNNRGYKKFPHIQIGINTDHIFIFVSIIDNPKHEHKMGRALLENPENWSDLPTDYVISGDHTKPKVRSISQEVVEQTLERLLKVKKGELLIGRIIENDSTLLENNEKQQTFIEETLQTILPLYKQLLDVYFGQED